MQKKVAKKNNVLDNKPKSLLNEWCKYHYLYTSAN